MLSEPKAQPRKGEELLLSLDRVGDIALHLLPGNLPDASVSAKGVLLLGPLMFLSRSYQLVLTSQLVMKHLIFALSIIYK